MKFTSCKPYVFTYDAVHKDMQVLQYRAIVGTDGQIPVLSGSCFGSPPPGAQAALPDASESRFSEKTIADVALSGLSIFPSTGTMQKYVDCRVISSTY